MWKTGPETVDPRQQQEAVDPTQQQETVDPRQQHPRKTGLLHYMPFVIRDCLLEKDNSAL